MQNLEERLLKFSSLCIKLTNQMPNTMASSVLARQLVRSGTSTALNYAESQGASSKKDWIHKYRLVLKEMRESHMNLRIIDRNIELKDKTSLKEAILEADRLTGLFVNSIRTAENNLNKKKPKKSKKPKWPRQPEDD